MSNTIKLAHHATSGKTPTNLAAGEVAINSTNKKVWVGTNGTTAGQVLVFDHSLYSTDLSDNDTTYTAGAGLFLSGTVFSHNDTSSQSSIDGTGRQYIQDVTLDTYGHVTGLGVATETLTNTDTTYSAGTGLSLSGTTFNMNAAGNGVRGGVKLGYTESGQFYPVEAHNTSEKLYVNVPWQNTTYAVQDGGLTQKNFTTTLKSKLDGITGYNYSAGTGLSLSGTTFSIGAAWPNMPAGIRTNYTLGFQAPSSGYAGFYFQGTNGSNAGYFLIRGTNDTDVYTAEGITLVADQGWLTLAQRTASSRGVKIMTGSTTSTERLKITTAGDVQFVNGNSFTYNGNNIATQSWVSSQGFLTSETGDIQGVTAGSGLSGGGTSGTPTLSHADTSSQSSVNSSGRTYIQDVTLDTYGHVTGLATATETVTNTDTNTTYSAGSGLSLSSTTFSHSDTSSQGSVDNSGRSYIQDVTLDTYGHVTGLASATETVTNTDTNTTYSASTGLTLSGTTFSVDGNVLRKTTYYNANTWLQFSGTYGLYWNTGVGAGWHIYPVNTNTMRFRAAASSSQSALRFDAGGSTYGTILFTDAGEFQVLDEAGNERLSIPSSGSFVRDNSYVVWDQGNVAAGTGISISGNTITNTVTNTNTTYSAGSGLSLSGTSFSHSDTSSQNSVNGSGRTYIQDVTLDTYGHVTGLGTATETVTNTDTNTTYSAGSGLSLSSTTFSHSDTSSQGSVNNSARTYIQDVTLDTYGHVTGLASATETVTNTDTNTFRPVEAGGNTLGGSETLEFKSGSGISISESGGEVTLTCTVTNTNTANTSAPINLDLFKSSTVGPSTRKNNGARTPNGTNTRQQSIPPKAGAASLGFIS